MSCSVFIDMERGESHKYLGFNFHVIQNLAHGVSQLVSAAMPSMNRRWARLPISDPELQCKLFVSLVLISSYLASCG